VGAGTETKYAMNGDLAVVCRKFGQGARAYLVVGSGLNFEDRGARELKGVPGTWNLFAVAA
jgi:hypothetical protein